MSGTPLLAATRCSGHTLAVLQFYMQLLLFAFAFPSIYALNVTGMELHYTVDKNPAQLWKMTAGELFSSHKWMSMP